MKVAVLSVAGGETSRKQSVRDGEQYKKEDERILVHGRQEQQYYVLQVKNDSFSK